MLETNMTEIFTRIDEQNKLERQEVFIFLFKLGFSFRFLMEK